MTGRYRYVVHHAISADELEPLQSGIEDEPEFRLAELVGAAELKAMFADGNVDFDITAEQRFFAFGNSLALISVYLSEYVSGVEVVELLDASQRRTHVECWRYIGRQGELVTVPLEHAVSLDRHIVLGHEDLGALRAMWRELPAWARTAYKLTYDELADLDAGG